MTILAASLLPFAGCTPIDIGLWGTGHPEGGDRGRDSAAVSLPDTSVYVSGVEFPEGYDWAVDSAYGSVRATLVLYRDSTRTLELQAGPGTTFSADPDMHRIAEGHLYTDYSSDKETIVCKDGKKLFRYGSAESITDFLLRDGDIYTLGVPRSGGGLSFRRNGDELFGDDGGSLVGRLHEDGGHLYFAYYTTTGVAEAIATRTYYIVEDGVPIRVSMEDGTSEVLDIKMIDGALNMAVCLKGSAVNPWIVQDGVRKSVGNKGFTPIDGSLCRLSSGEVRIAGHDRSSNGSVSAILWAASAYDYRAEGVKSALIVRDGRIFVLSSYGQLGFQLRAMNYKSVCNVSTPAVYFIDNGLFVDPDRLLFAYTPMDGGKQAALWDNGETKTLQINGFLTGVARYP